MSDKPKVLYIDDEKYNLTAFKSAFRRHYKVYTALTADEGIEIIKDVDIPVVITDQRMPEITGVEFLERVVEIHPQSMRMILTGFSDVEAIVDAINRGGVYRYITKPWDKDELKITIDNALESFGLRQHNKELIESLKEANSNLEEKVKLRTAEVIKQKEETDKLLLNILPKTIAEELKESGKAEPQHYDKVSVLFTDFKGFTQISETKHPNELVQELDYCFHAFDDIVENNNLEKIKTIGDAYMCAGGIPVASEKNAIDAVNAALEMQEFVNKWNTEREGQGLSLWELRVGVHTGPIVAGVVGKKKFAYDIWGSTVNTAARMESSGEPTKVNISGSTYELVKDYFNCTFRGKVSAKNMGEIDMYFVDSKK